MIKSVFALVVLLHLCYNAEVNFNLSVEIIGGLEQLIKLNQENKVNITSSGQLRAPRTKHVSSCIGVFTRELKQLLNNVSVSEDYTDFLRALKDNLQVLEPRGQIEPKFCETKMVKNSTMTFRAYIFFLKKLNNSKKR